MDLCIAADVCSNHVPVFQHVLPCKALEAEAEALLRQLRAGGGGWSSLKRGLQAAWGKPPTPRRPQLGVN